MIVIIEHNAAPIISQNGVIVSSCGSGSFTFIEKRLTISVGNIMQIEKMVSFFMRILKLLLMTEALASMRLATTSE